MARLVLLLSFCIITQSVCAQRYILSKGTFTFFSEATLEDIKADNKKGTSIFNVASGEIAFAIPNNEFQFEKKLMQQHFNEKYMESDKYPRSTFSGKVEGFNRSTSGKQNVKAVGKLFIHGVTKEVNIPGTMEILSNTITLESSFIIKLADYKIKIPQLLWQNIAEQVEVTVEVQYMPQ